MRAVIVAVDIGATLTKGATSSAGGFSRVVFPTRIGLGERAAMAGYPAPRYVRMKEGVVRLGDVTQRDGVVESEIPPAITSDEALAACIAAVVDHFKTTRIDVLMINATPSIIDLKGVDVRQAMTRALCSDGSALPVPGKVGVMDINAANIASVVLSRTGDIDLTDNGDLPDKFSVADCSPSALRIVHVKRQSGGRVVFDSQTVEVDYAIERALCAEALLRWGVPIRGVPEAMMKGYYMTGKTRRSLAPLIEIAKSVGRAAHFPALAQSVTAAGSDRLILSGGHATVFQNASSEENDYVSRVANQSETSILRGLFRAARRWGESA